MKPMGKGRERRHLLFDRGVIVRDGRRGRPPPGLGLEGLPSPPWGVGKDEKHLRQACWEKPRPGRVAKDLEARFLMALEIV
jgi:hypothetical protein